MVANSSGCDPARIRLLLEDRLPGDGQTELERHLETCVECRQQLESQAAGPGWWDEARRFLGPDPNVSPSAAPEPADAPSAAPAARQADDADELLPGVLQPSDNPAMLGRLGPYEIVEVIGRGGMGIVLKGFDPQLNRFVAIKVLAPHLAASGAARQRFMREARAAAAVVHEHVVAIHTIDVDSGLSYLVMPLIAGESLEQRIDRSGPLELKEILRIGAQVAEGLGAAHAQGLVHRDIKPANILLENGVERVKITDFGLARAIDDATVTHSGFLAGTPQYMAPEQARGEMIDHRCDLFSLGSVLYAMCAGHSPFRAETTMAVLRRICEDSPTPVRQVNADIPDWLAKIIEKLHAKDPAERFQSAAEVADLLGRHLAHCQQPWAVPMPPPVRYRSPAARAASRRLRWIAAAGLLVLGAAAGAAGLVDRVAGVGGDSRTEAWVDHQTPSSPGVATPGLGTGSGSASRAGLNGRAERAARGSPDPALGAGGSLQTREETLAARDDAVVHWDPLPEEIERVYRDLGELEAQWRRSSQSNADTRADPVPEIHARLDMLEMQLQADGP